MKTLIVKGKDLVLEIAGVCPGFLPGATKDPPARLIIKFRISSIPYSFHFLHQVGI
jgi:hypothetical protein